MVRRVLCAAVCTLVVAVGFGTAGPSAAVGGPTVTPARGGNGVPVIFAQTTFDLAKVGYRQSEFFLAGTATAYRPKGAFEADGKWTLEPASTARYKTRIVVNRPVSRPFNGTVVVEWLNVSGGVDASPDWVHTHDELIRNGYAWVGVSAQTVGVDQLKTGGDPARYASLDHPGDSYSYDMFSQAGRAVRFQPGQILGGLEPARVIAAGESQSAFRLTTYINGVHPRARAFDGFLVHSRGGGSAAVSQSPQPDIPTPGPTLIRNDLNTPVLIFETETDLITLGYAAARQPDSRRVITWEVAGTAHYDLYGLRGGATDMGGQSSVDEWFASLQNPTNEPYPGIACESPINSGPQTYVLRAALSSLDSWVRGGRRPSASPRLATTNTDPPELVVDRDGIGRGGIRVPGAAAPVATISGLGQGSGGFQFCGIFGSTVPFSQAKLEARYGRHAGFATAWADATEAAKAGGFLRPADARQILAAGQRSDILR